MGPSRGISGCGRVNRYVRGRIWSVEGRALRLEAELVEVGGKTGRWEIGVSQEGHLSCSVQRMGSISPQLQVLGSSGSSLDLLPLWASFGKGRALLASQRQAVLSERAPLKDSHLGSCPCPSMLRSVLHWRLSPETGSRSGFCLWELQQLRDSFWRVKIEIHSSWRS